MAVAWCAIPQPTMPGFDEVRARWQPSDAQLLDRHGEPLHEVRIDRHGRRLPWTALEDISPALTGVVIRSEDRRFWQHRGVDLRAVARSLRSNLLAHRGGGGASTITMQLAALLDPALAPARRRRSMWQKILQMKAAFAIERRWSKRQILEAYLNLVTYRGELQGVSVAARVMFGQQPSGIDPGEALVMAALLRAPNARRPALERRAQALRLAMGTDAPAPAEVADAIGRAAALRGSDSSRVMLAPGLAQRWLSGTNRSLRCTLDRGLQGFAARSLRSQILQVRDRQVADGAVLVVENATGQVWAYVAGTGDLSSAPYVDGVRALRQPGSTLKPFLYGLALERRLLTPASLLLDTPLELPEERGLYRPLDYDRQFRGLVSMRTALASSLNVPAVRTASLIGVDALAEHLRRLGFTEIDEPGDYYGASIALGSPDVSLWNLANAYRTLANAGMLSPMRLFAAGGASSSVSIYSPATAYLISDILADRASRSATFGLENNLATRYWSAVKTGTSKDMRDNWCVGYTGRFTVGVWVGNFSGAAMHDVTGITGAAPVWLEVMDYLYERFGASALARPAGLRAKTVEFPGVAEPPRMEWFIAGTEPSAPIARLNDRSPRILSPAAETIIALDPDIPHALQRVRFEAEPSAADARWMLDSLDLGPSAELVLWPPTPGPHVLALKDRSGHALDQVSFKVRGSE
ncbi:MAG TPA: penicillin-binding protein 1C [Candidatus Binataceae bacterium]|jgi:penicillin-binding protein 1C|nr:penicillin-binding protein 1C [Candidatus Binataceae bacterium]